MNTQQMLKVLGEIRRHPIQMGECRRFIRVILSTIPSQKASAKLPALYLPEGKNVPWVKHAYVNDMQGESDYVQVECN